NNKIQGKKDEDLILLGSSNYILDQNKVTKLNSRAIIDLLSKTYNDGESQLGYYLNNHIETEGIKEMEVIAPEYLKENAMYTDFEHSVQRSYTILNVPKDLNFLKAFLNSKIRKYLSIHVEEIDKEKLKSGLIKYFNNELNKNIKGEEKEEKLIRIRKINNRRDSLVEQIDKIKGRVYTQSIILSLVAENTNELTLIEDKVRRFFLKHNCILRSLHTNHIKAYQSNVLGRDFVRNKMIYETDNENRLNDLNINDLEVKLSNNESRLTTQDSLFYDSFLEDGILYLGKNKYSKCYVLKDINFETLDDDEQENIVLRFATFLNSFAPEQTFQVTINNQKIFVDEFVKEILLKPKEDGKDHLRQEYNEMLIEKIEKGINSIERRRYLTVTVEAKNYNEAREHMNVTDDIIKRNIKTVGSGDKNNSDVMELERDERIKLLYNLFNPGKERYFKYYNIDEMIKQGLTTKDIIAPDYLEFKIDYIILNDTYLKFFFVSGLPNMMNASFFAGLNESFNHPIISTITYVPYEQKKATKMVNDQYLNLNAELESVNKKNRKNGGTAFVSPKLELEINETKDLLDDVTQRDQKLFSASVVIGIFAKSKRELENTTKLVKDYCERKMVTISSATAQQEHALNTVLPLGNDLIPIKRTLTSEAGAIFLPFKSQNVMDRTGIYYGVNPANKDLLLINRKKFSNGNGFILGKPGGGKSFSAKNEMLNYLLTTNDDVIIIDPESEYGDLCHNLDGEFIRIDQNSPYHVNLFDIEENDQEDGGWVGSIREKANFISGCVEIMIGDSGLTIEEKAILDESINKVYNAWFDYKQRQEEKGQPLNPKYFPTLQTLKQYLDNYSGRERQDAYRISTALKMYTSGTNDMFNHHTNFDPSNRLIVYDIKGLHNDGTLKQLAMNVIMDSIWNRLLRNGKNGKPTWIYIDEIYLLFSNLASMEFLKNLWKRARKYNGFPTGITQNVNDLLNIPQASTMLANADFILMLNQATQDRVNLAALLGLGETLQTYVTDSPPGSGLIYTNMGTIPFENKFPKDTQMYEMLTTNPHEKAEIARKRKQKEKEFEENLK
ncbi:MAG: ATP-binding protein, partial [Helcococcus sp.]|nr:ATP-binding protein [Helcococcus sp.]